MNSNRPWTLFYTLTALGQQSRISLEQGQQVLVGLLWLVLAAVVLGLAFWALRTWLSRRNQQQVDTGFTLNELRRLHREGELTDEQYEAAKAVLAARGLGAMGGTAKADSQSVATAEESEQEEGEVEGDEGHDDADDADKGEGDEDEQGKSDWRD